MTKDIEAAEKILSDPLAIFTQILDFKRDMQEMQHFGAIYENVSKCKFEESLLDILKMCTSHPDQCQVSVLLQNLSKNVFVLVGKATSLAETFKGFPSSENDEFREQMKELGQDTGTFIRVIFNYEKRDDDYQQPQIQPEEPKHEDPKPVEPK